MGRWVIVGFVVLAGVVFWLSRPAEDAAPSTDAPQAVVDPVKTAPPAAPDTDPVPDAPKDEADAPRYEFAKLADEDEAGIDWRTERADGFENARLSPEALEALENPKPEEEDSPETQVLQRYQYDAHIEGLIDGTAKSEHEETVNDFMAENPPGRHRWSIPFDTRPQPDASPQPAQ
jgi:hypothetical protein